MDCNVPGIEELRFLVAEDHGFQRWVIEHALDALGAKHVFCAANGQAALEIFRNVGTPIDIVVTDLAMPEMDGMAFIRHLGESKPPVSLIVASALDRSLVALVEGMAREYGVNLLGALSKPVTRKKLGTLIRLHQQRAEEVVASRLAANLTVEEILRGLELDQFEPFFQPKVDLQTGLVTGAEALARWVHPLHGVVPPAAFIGVLESFSRLDRLTTIMACKAAEACSRWRSAGSEASVSINVSPVSLGDVEFATRMTNVVQDHGLQPRDVIVEVTETALASNPGRVLENLSRLRMNGFGLSIDDFGTGYASMLQLAAIPFTELKVDQSFVRNALRVKGSMAMLESSLEIASKLAIDAVAEGVETQEELDLLLRLDCRFAQGYLFARPMGAAEFHAWLGERPKFIRADRRVDHGSSRS